MRQTALANRCSIPTVCWALLAVTLASVCRPALAQTPSPLQDWQYSRGWDIARLFDAKVPDLIILTGAAFEQQPMSEGSDYYRNRLGPVIEVRYKDTYFFSMGEGLGMNLFTGKHYTLGVAAGYDTGRKEEWESGRLRGLPDIPPAPSARVFGSYTVSKQFPLVIKADVRHFFGGVEGTVATLGAYLPLPGSSDSTFFFAGPGVTWSDHDHMQRVYGIDAADAMASGYPQFAPRAGISQVGFGLSATHVFSKRWILNFDAAVSRMDGSDRDSPLTQQNLQHVATLSMAYRW